MTSIKVPLAYPLAAVDEQRAINRTALAVATVHRMIGTKEYSREWLDATLRRYLRDGNLSICEKAVEAADNQGDEIADAALRDVGAELQMPLVQGRDLAAGHLQIIAYFQRAGRRPPHKRKRGRYHWSDDWLRNLGICFLVQLTCAEYGVRPTRNRESRRAVRQPSGISLVTAALARNRIYLDEATIQRKIWFGLPGELARRVAAERPIETWFQSSV
jgi:hypothetical protein